MASRDNVEMTEMQLLYDLAEDIVSTQCEVPRMVDIICFSHHYIPPANHRLVHCKDLSVWPVGILDDIPVTEVMVGGK